MKIIYEDEENRVTLLNLSNGSKVVSLYKTDTDPFNNPYWQFIDCIPQKLIPVFLKVSGYKEEKSPESGTV